MGLLILPYELVCLPTPGDRITTLRIPARNYRHRRRAVRRSGSVLPDAPSSTRKCLIPSIGDVDANEISIAMVFNNTAVE